MKPLPVLCILGLLAVVSFAILRQKDTEIPSSGSGAPESSSPVDVTRYAPLAMEEIFTLPAGPKGLEYSPKARSLDGEKVSVSGYMVRHAHADTQIFLFAPTPMVLFQAEYGTADDLPPYALHVITEKAPIGQAARYVRKELKLLGTLQLGARQEMDGRISHARLLLDHAISPDSRDEIPILASLALQPERLVNASRESTTPLTKTP